MSSSQTQLSEILLYRQGIASLSSLSIEISFLSMQFVSKLNVDESLVRLEDTVNLLHELDPLQEFEVALCQWQELLSPF